MLSELFWILAGITYSGTQVYKEQVRPRNVKEFHIAIGANIERQHYLEYDLSMGTNIRKNEEFDKLVGYEWRNEYNPPYRTEYLVREIAKREGWTYIGSEISQSPAYCKASKCKKDVIRRAEKRYAEITPYPERQAKLIAMATSENELDRAEFKKIIGRNYKHDDPISVEVAMEQAAWREGWLYVHTEFKSVGASDYLADDMDTDDSLEALRMLYFE